MFLGPFRLKAEPHVHPTTRGRPYTSRLAWLPPSGGRSSAVRVRSTGSRKRHGYPMTRGASRHTIPADDAAIGGVERRPRRQVTLGEIRLAEGGRLHQF